jgi:hypothetical protein
LALAFLVAEAGIRPSRTSVPAKVLNRDRIYVLPDAHCGAFFGSNAGEEALAQTILNDPFARALVLNADIPTGEGAHEDEAFRIFLDPLRDAGIEVYGAPGNHDADPASDPLAPYGLAPYQHCFPSDSDTTDAPYSHFASIFPEVSPQGWGAASFGDVLLVFLNTNADTTNSSGDYIYGSVCPPGWFSPSYGTNSDYPGIYYNSKQKAWLSSLLRQSPARHKIVFSGRSFYNSRIVFDGRPMIRNRGGDPLSLVSAFEPYASHAWEADPHAAFVTKPIKGDALVVSGPGTTYLSCHGTGRDSLMWDPLANDWLDIPPTWYDWIDGTYSAVSDVVYAVMQFTGDRVWTGFYYSDPVNPDPLLYEFVVNQEPEPDNLYVTKFGNDNNPGSYFYPKRTLAGALRAASPGDTVFIEAGDYVESDTSGVSGTAAKPIVVIGDPAALLTSTTGYIKYQELAYVRFQGVNYRGASVMVQGSHHLTFSECTFEGGASLKLEEYNPHGSWISTHHVDVNLCIVEGDYGPKGSASPNTGVSFGNGTYCSTLTGCQIYGCDNGVDITSDTSGSSHLTRQHVLSENLIYDNPNHGIYIGRYARGITFKNNACWNNQEMFYLAGVETCAVYNNVFYAHGDHDNGAGVIERYNSGGITRTSRYVTLRNNILTSCDWFYSVDSYVAADATFGSEYNCFWRPGAVESAESPECPGSPTNHWFQYGGTGYDTIADYRAATGHEDLGKSVAQDPTWLRAGGLWKEFSWDLDPGSYLVDHGDPGFPVPPGGGSCIDIGPEEYIYP